jgi:hypothetical protein
VDSKSIEFTIKNQQFTPYIDSSGNTIGLYYNFRYKGNYVNNWTYYPENSNGQSVIHYNGGLGYDYEMYPPIYGASNSDYTLLTLGLSFLGPPLGQTIPIGVNVNFQAQALIGYFNKNEFGYYILTGESSDWSSTKTITIGETSASTSPTPTPTVPEFSWLAILPLFVSVLFIAFKLRHQKPRT